jgi:hypothetical protein
MGYIAVNAIEARTRGLKKNAEAAEVAEIGGRRQTITLRIFYHFFLTNFFLNSAIIPQQPLPHSALKSPNQD